MAVQGFADDLFDGSLDFPCTYLPKAAPSFAVPAVLAFEGFDVGSEAGKGLSKADKQASAEWKHFRVPATPFKSRSLTPEFDDRLKDDNGDEWAVQRFAPSRAGTYIIYARRNAKYKGPDSGITRI